MNTSRCGRGYNRKDLKEYVKKHRIRKMHTRRKRMWLEETYFFLSELWLAKKTAILTTHVWSDVRVVEKALQRQKCFRVLPPESVNGFIEDQAFSPWYDFASPHKLSLILSLPVCRQSSILAVGCMGRDGVGEEPKHTTSWKPGPL